MDALAQILGDSAGIVTLRQQIRRLLDRPSDVRRMPTILIEGETGTGKGLVARALHAAGPRSAGPFIDVNCAAIPATLLEAEMFGVERGAFTDAKQSKPGLFQLANRGTIFLDEIGLLPEPLQAKLLKAIEEREVRRLGGTRNEPFDVWVLAATNEALATAVREGRFRADLYHRLAVVSLVLPPLRERGADTVALAHHFLARACADYGLAQKTLSASAVAAIHVHPWPGNVRELSNVMERVALLSEGTSVSADSLGLVVEAPAAAPRSPAAPAPRTETLDAAMNDVEREHLLAALNATGWNVTQTAVRLGISRNTLRYRMEKHQLRQNQPAARRTVPTPTAAPAVVDPARPAPAAPADDLRTRRRVTLVRVGALAPEERSASARGLLQLVSDKVESFGGRVQDSGERALIAAFGLESAEDGPRRAAAAARAVQNAVARGRGWRDAGVSVVLTLHVVETIVSRDADGMRMESKPEPAALALLDGLAESAGPGAVVVSDAAAALLDRRFDLMRVGAPGAGYRLVGPERTGLGVGLGGRMTAFVGRRAELDTLRARLDTAARGRGQLVAIVGEAGIGKSRLLFEFRHALAKQPFAHVGSHCVPYGPSLSYLPMLELLRGLCGIGESDATDTVVAKVADAVGKAGMDAETAAYLLHFLRVEASTAHLASLPSEIVKSRTFEILRRLIVRRSAMVPLVLVIEDLHWIDKTSEECLGSLIDGLPTASVLLVVTYRPGYRPRWLERSFATPIAIHPLAPEESRQVVESVLAGDAVPRAVFDAVLQKAEGNPFFLEELTRGLREQEAAPVTVPDTIQEVLLARIDRLGADEKRLLHVAAVIGKNVAGWLLQVVSGLPADVLRERLHRLQAAEFIVESGGGAAEASHTFKHSLIQEVAYESLLPDDRRALHSAIVNALETHPARTPEHADSLAHHAFWGEVWDKAVTHLWRAGARAVSRSAHWEAVTFFEQALVALRQLPQNRARREQALDLRFDLRNALQVLGEFESMLDHLKAAETLAQTLGDDRRLGQVYAYVTDYHRLTGDLDRAMEFGLRARAIAERLQDLPLLIATNTWMGQVQYGLGRYRAAEEFFEKNLALLQGERANERFNLPQLPAVHTRTCLVWALGELGRFDEGLRLGDEAVRLAEAADHPLSLIVARSGLGVLHLRRGDAEAAVAELEQALRLSETWRTPLWFPRVASVLGVAHAHAGRHEPALQLTEQAVVRGASMKVAGGQSQLVTNFSEACLLAGRHAQARELAQQAVQLARQQKERGNEAWALHTLAEATDDRASAIATAEAALALARELTMEPLIGRCRRTLQQLGAASAT
jgi:DNA-binding NtrC family response regulator/tetratricopeptide (TPR) repeat protein